MKLFVWSSIPGCEILALFAENLQKARKKIQDNFKEGYIVNYTSHEEPDNIFVNEEKMICIKSNVMV